MANKPIHEIRNGVVKVSIWKNENEKGVFFNTTLEKLYKKGEKWQSSKSFSRDQLLIVSRLAQEANAWIYEESNRELRKEEETSSDANEKSVA